MEEKCSKCGMPIGEATKCSCKPDICHYCCDCEPGCTCGCEKK